MSGNDLRLLLVEDSEADAELLLRALRKEGFGLSHRRVDSAEAIREALEETWDVVLVDHAVPGVSPAEVLAEVAASRFAPPAIVVSGVLEEESAVSMLRAGARDFVTKANLARLAPAVRRELETHALLRVERSIRARLEESGERFAKLVESARDIVLRYRLRPRPMLEYVSPSVQQMLGYTPEELYADPELVHRIVHPDDRPHVMDALLDAPEEPVVGRALTSDGRVVWFERRSVALRDDKGEVVAIEAIVHDVTDRMQALEQAASSVDTFRAVFEGALDAMLLADDEGRYVDANPAACVLIGLPREQLLGRSAADFCDPALVDAIPEHWRTFLEAGSARGEFLVHRPDGGTRETDFVAKANVMPGIHLSILRDISERRRAAELEERVRQLQKLEAVGRLAGGIAHDFNNLLTVINGYSDVLLEDSVEPEQQRTLAEIRRAGERAADLTRQLLAFSRKQVLRPETVDLNEIVRDHLAMLTRLLGEDIDVRVTLENAPAFVEIDPGQLAQVLVNLATNARDAMHDGGTFAITTRLGEHDVLLRVSDTGDGMTDETKGRLFEPFFTTKPPGQGTGLGLPTVHGIIEQSGGRVEVESAPGAGATFEIFLPRAAGPGSPASEHQPAQPELGRPTVLLVEDDQAVRTVAETMLRSAGCDVIAAGSPAEAVTLADSATPLDVLVTDVVMPELNGRQLAKLIAAERPRLRVVYMSGYTDDAMISRGVLPTGTTFVQKPFTSAQLVEAVSRALEAGPPPPT